MKSKNAAHRSEEVVSRVNPISRREFALRTALAAAPASVLTGWSALLADEQPVNAAPKTSQEALTRLLAGNRRFVEGQLRHPHLGNDWRKRLVGGQKPFATILGCSDSRVPPELLFDQGFGDLFVIRVAGNVIDVDVAGSIEYGVDHLGTKLVVVMGHDGCGAVTAALQADADLKREPNEIQALVGKIKPAVKKVDASTSFEVRLRRSVEANVRASVKLLKGISDLAGAVKAKRTRIVGCVYDIQSGGVRTLDG